MSNLKYFFLLLVLSFSYASHASITVGTCKSASHSYETISAAISEAKSGEVIDVCPGTYAEQLVITKPLSIHGIGTVTLVFPPNGLRPITEKSGTYSQVFVNHPGGPVELSFISIQGGNRFKSPYEGDSHAIAGETLCLTAPFEDYSGVLSFWSPTVLDHVNVIDHSVAPTTGGTILSVRTPHCGGGIAYRGDGGIVRNSVVRGFGLYGIRGAEKVEHNVVSGAGGPHSVGISASGDVSDNTVTGPGFVRLDTTGIQSGKSVRGNTVQAWATGITGPMIRENKLSDNETGVSKIGEATGNIILASATYPNLACAQPGAMCTDRLPGSNVPAALPTVGVNLGCSGGASVRHNRIEGVGIGFADVSGGSALADNSLTGVGSASTACSK